MSFLFTALSYPHKDIFLSVRNSWQNFLKRSIHWLLQGEINAEQKKIKFSYQLIPFIVDFKICLCTRCFDSSVQPLGVLWWHCRFAKAFNSIEFPSKYTMLAMLSVLYCLHENSIYLPSVWMFITFTWVFRVSVSGPLPSPVLSILLAVFTLSPNKQYLGILIPTTPATHGPTKENFYLIWFFIKIV